MTIALHSKEDQTAVLGDQATGCYMVDVDIDIAKRLADEWAAELEWLADR